ncbi:hypothetical protein QVD17_19102 [Tagetes erecta]|uniref:Uncharacterized protein n=1 Tax=Tagetes erecta TaxID=13708 RepID=A0AAD8KJ34_TARER|nr:hypothetical protein QVD17_19102 [Tagetes erecta]
MSSAPNTTTVVPVHRHIHLHRRLLHTQIHVKTKGVTWINPVHALQSAGCNWYADESLAVEVVGPLRSIVEDNIIGTKEEVQVNFQKRRGHAILSPLHLKFSDGLGEALDVAGRWSADVVS